MKKNFVFLFLIFMFLPLWAKDTCYSVQLFSRVGTIENNSTLTQEYPDDCQMMHIGNASTLRCGCFESFSEAKTRLEALNTQYKQAMVVTTYSYRFHKTQKHNYVEEGMLQPLHSEKKIQTKKAVKKTHKKKRRQGISSSNQELRLMLQVFLYKGDLANAYKVASIGVRRYPRSFYWNEKMAQIAQWTNHSKESMKYLKRAYDVSKDPQIETKLIEYGASNYQYEAIEPLVLNRLKRDHSEKNVNLMIFVYKKIGVPERILQILDQEYARDPQNEMLLTKALRISLEMGSLEDAKKYVAALEQRAPYSKESATLIARYYYIKRDVLKAYEALLAAKTLNDEKEDYIQKYYELSSDLGWYLQKNLEAAKASKKLMQMDKGRLVDYERIAFVYKETDPDLAKEAVLQGYKKFRLSYLFYSYANDAINLEKYEELRDLMKQIIAINPDFEKEALYWILKAKVYGHFKQRDKEEEALFKALNLAPNSYQVKVSLLWHFLDIEDDYKLKVLLMSLEEDNQLDRSLYFPMASAYFYLKNINRTSFYIQKILEDQNAMADTTEFMFLQSYVYQIQNREDAFKRIIKKIVISLKQEAQENPKLWENERFLSLYLRASMNVLRNEKFEKLLKLYKPYITRKDYQDIAYSYALKIGARAKAHKVYNKMKIRDLWVEFSHVLLFTNHSKIENLLDKYLMTLSRGDVIVAAKDDGQIALAQSLNFYSFDQNSFNQNMYIQHMDLVKKRTSLFDAKLSYYNRKPLLQKYVKVKNQTYLQDAYYLYTGVDYFNNRSLDHSLFTNLQQRTLNVLLGIKKVFNRAYVGLNTHYHDNYTNYFSYSLYGGYQITDRILLDLELAKAVDTPESTQLYIAGKKDMVSPRFRYRIVPSTLIDIKYEKAKYYSSDDVFLGRGDYARFGVSKLYKSGYPDINIGLFYDRGLYNESDQSNGVIDTIQTQDFPVLPRDFYNIGMNFAYGMVNSDIYTRVWRPFFEFSTYYNSDIDDYSFGINGGLGGKLFSQDHLVCGFNYTESVNGVGGTIFELYLNYKFLYHLPR